MLAKECPECHEISDDMVSCDLCHALMCGDCHSRYSGVCMECENEIAEAYDEDYGGYND